MAFPRELVVIAKREVGMRASPSGLESTRGVSTTTLENLLKKVDAKLTPLFGKSEDSILKNLNAENPSFKEEDTALHLFYHVESSDDSLESLQEQLLANDLVDGAYIKPKGEVPVMPDMEVSDTPLIDSPPIDGVPATPPDFTNRQIYLNAAPQGIDARYAWTLRGGRGHNVRIIDLEWGWRFNRMDLDQNQGGVLSGTNSTTLRSENHGTAVIGEYSGDPNSNGITGICPDA